MWSFGVVMYEVVSAGREEAPTFLAQKDFEKISRTSQLPFQIRLLLLLLLLMLLLLL